MVLFEEKMIDENRIYLAEIIDNFNSKKIYRDSILSIHFIPEIQSPPVHIRYSTHEEAISKLNQFTTLINSRNT